MCTALNTSSLHQKISSTGTDPSESENFTTLREISPYTKKSWCIRDFSTLVSSHINIPHGIVLVFFMHLDWYLMNSLTKVATNTSNRCCPHMWQRSIRRNKSVSMHLNQHTKTHQPKHTNQTDVSSKPMSLHLPQTTTSNIKAKQKLTCVHTFSLLECSSCRSFISLTTAVTIHTQHTFGVDTLLSEGAQYDLWIRIWVHQMNPQSLTTELRSTYVKRKIDNIA